MLRHGLLFFNSRTLQAEVVAGQGTDDLAVRVLAHLRDDGDIVEDGAQDGLVVLYACIRGLLVLAQETLCMLYLSCQLPRVMYTAH